VNPVEFSKDLFARRIGHRFLVGDPPESIEIELIEVSPLDAPEPRPFAVTFRGPLSPLLSQSIHRLLAEGEQPLELFLVPLGPDRERRHLLYEAVFN
jgi:hypothetical protein